MKKYIIKKRFSIPVGHRLSKHSGRCLNYHGHNFYVEICASSHILNLNDMVIDFSDLKTIVMSVLDEWDHCLLLNKNDSIAKDSRYRDMYRIIAFDFDPTSEKLAEVLYYTLSTRLKEIDKNIKLEHVEVFENDKSSTIFMEI